MMPKKRKSRQKTQKHQKWMDDPCEMAGCSRNVQIKSAGLCNACYHFLYYWKNQSVPHLMKRARTLQFWNERMETFVEDKTNIITNLPKKRKRRKAA